MPFHNEGFARQACRQFGPVATGAGVQQAAGSGKMLGHAMRFIFFDAQLSRTLVKEGADGQFDRNREQKDQKDPPDQPERRPYGVGHRRDTSTLNI